MGREKIIKNIVFLPPKMVKPPPIKPILWSPVKSEKSQKLTKMSFLDFYQYLGLFSMDGRHVPLWERDSACGRGILPVEERFCLWKRDSACGRGLSLWERDMPLWDASIPLEEPYPYVRALFPEKKNENGNPKYHMEILKKKSNFCFRHFSFF